MKRKKQRVNSVSASRPGRVRLASLAHSDYDWRKIMSNISGPNARPRERGAISIKVLLALVMVGIAAFTVIKVAPVYIDERQLKFKVDDLTNKSAVRNSKEEDINKAIAAIRKEYSLPENSINIVSREPGRVNISLTYQKDIDLLVTTYQWKVNYTSAGKDL